MSCSDPSSRRNPVPWTRRGVLRGMGAVAAGACLWPGRAGAGAGDGRVVLRRVGGYGEHLERVLIEGIRAFPGLVARIPGARVLLKPNFVEYRPGRPVNTHVRMVLAAAEAFRRLGAEEVRVGEGPGHQRDTELVLESSGLGPALREQNLDFVDLNVDPVVPVPLWRPATGLSSIPVAAHAVAADLLVSMPRMKTHHWAGVTLSLKNLFGVVPGVAVGWPKNVLHMAGIHRSIEDVWRACPPAFSIVDGIVAMEGDGPIEGDPVNMGVVALGTDPLAVDATCVRLMGMEPEDIEYLERVARHGGDLRKDRIEVAGDDVPPRSFAPPPNLGWWG